jgi:CRP-like cAMP-binding protein
MRDPALIRKMLALRQFPAFTRADVNELVLLAENVAERSFAAGELVGAQHLYFVTDGMLGAGDVHAGPHEILGWLDAVAERHAKPAHALVPTRTLAIDASDYLDVLDDSFGLLLATIRDLAVRVCALGERRDRAELPRIRHDALGLAERILVLRQLFPLSCARLDPLSILAHAAVERRCARGDEITADALIVLAGSVRAGDRVLAPGDAIGIVEALANTPIDVTLRAATDARVLELRSATLCDVLEDHTDVALAIARALGEVLVDDSDLASPGHTC